MVAIYQYCYLFDMYVINMMIPLNSKNEEFHHGQGNVDIRYLFQCV